MCFFGIGHSCEVSLTFNGKKYLGERGKFSERKINFYDANESKLETIERIWLGGEASNKLVATISRIFKLLTRSLSKNL
jgi:hypothetical protein